MNPFFFYSKSAESQTRISNEFYFSVRIAKLKDLKSVSEILTNSFHSLSGIMSYARPFLQLSIYEDLRNRIRSKGHNYLCLVALLVKDTQSSQGLSAMREHNLVGTVEISVRSRSGTDAISFHPWQLDNFEYVYLCNLAVDKNYRRLGVAQKLLYSCERQVLEWGFSDLYLHVLENNYTARRLYYRAGYRLQEVEWTWGSLLFGQPRKLFLHKHISPKIN